MASMNKEKTVCIVGAGESGLAALKECTLQGLHPTCYELNSDIGGLWHKKGPNDPRNTPSIWPSLVTNSSKYNACFSDFPPDPRDPVFMSAQQVVAYFKRAIKHFNLEQYICLNTRVVKVQEAPDYDHSGKWEVYTMPSNREETDKALAGCHKEVFDNVLICSGWYKKPSYPEVPGVDKFKGSISHSYDYSDPRDFDRKNVLIVGNKFSAAEIVCDISSFASKTYMALGTGTWIVPRLCKDGIPLDLSLPRSMIFSSDPKAAFDRFILAEACIKMNHTKSGVGTSSLPTESPLCISDELPVKLASGKIIPFGHLAELTERDAIFKEGHTVKDLDAVVFCTGYKTDFPFLDFSFRDDQGLMQQFLGIFPLKRKHNTLGFIGMYGTDGAMIVMVENQARLAVAVMAGKHQLPSQDAMAKDVKFWSNMSLTRRKGYHNYSVPGNAFSDAVAIEGGFYPSFWRLLFRDPLLAWQTWYGPYFAAQYRLFGPGSQYEEARKICHRAYEEDMGCVRHAEAKKISGKSDSPHLGQRGNPIYMIGFLCLAVGVFVGMRWPEEIQMALSSV